MTRLEVTRGNPSGGPPPAGPYSQVARVEVGGGALLFLAGQVALDDAGDVVAPDDMAAQADHIFQGIGALLGAHGAGFGDIISLRAFVTDIDRIREYGAAAAKYIGGPPPTSTTVEVSRLFRPGAVIEVEAAAAIGSPPAEG